MKIAVIGAGIAGLGCAYALRRTLRARARITLFEAAERLGGHAHTVDVTLDGTTYPVDTGFLVFNERTYPNLVRLFGDLRVPTAASDMSFAVSVALADGRRLEWAGTNLDTVFAQRRNLLSPAFARMLRDILRFNRQATRVAEGREDAGGLTLGAFLDRHGYGDAFRRWYLLPMAAAIWSCPTATMLAYPCATSFASSITTDCCGSQTARSGIRSPAARANTSGASPPHWKTSASTSRCTRLPATRRPHRSSSTAAPAASASTRSCLPATATSRCICWPMRTGRNGRCWPTSAIRRTARCCTPTRV